MLTWKSDWTQLARDWVIQAKDPSRVSLVDCERTGEKCLKLTALPGDDHVVGSGNMRRCDVAQIKPGTLDPQVHYTGEIWCAHSERLVSGEFWRPYWHPYNIFDWHNWPEGGVCATFAINFAADQRSVTRPGLLRAQLAFGNRDNPTYHNVIIGEPPMDTWLDFMEHIVWSTGASGKFDVWLNGRLVMSHRGPTLYDPVTIDGQTKPCGAYLKLPNYFLPVTPDELAQGIFAPTPASSVIHDRIRVGPTRASVE